MCSAFVAQGVRKLRITGGEPLVRRDVMGLFRSLSRHLASGALDELTLTTNGSQLGRFAAELADCGVRRVNVSVDTLDPGKFRSITRWGDLAQVLAGIEAAQEAGLRVKVNTVALKAVDEDEIETLIEWAHGRGMDLTVIEVMPLGDIEPSRLDQYLPLVRRAGAPVRTVRARGSRRAHGRTRALRAGAGDGREARVHHAVDPQFLRKLQPGPPHLYRTALHVPRTGGCGRSAGTRAGVGDDGLLEQAIAEAMSRKPKGHDFIIDRRHDRPAVGRHMSMTGG